MLRLGEKYPTAVILTQGFTADLYFAAVAFAEQQSRRVAFPAQQHRAAPFLEQQHGGQCDGWNLFQLALQQPPLQTRPSGCTRQQLGAQTLGREWQPSGQHCAAGGFVMQ
ncbi:hypothetical protein SDC9_192247 [bioreactor metagenome]|uniref:Uncharacterized protein n=1 Tax=bioreactor metagenome TaxID=1076179 RepID=A0A645I1R4_9ZZZZ